MSETSSIKRSEAKAFLVADIEDYYRLLKPRVMTLVVFTAAAGLLVAPGPINPIIALASILFIAIGGGASGALNMWWDADIDAKMRRTSERPTVKGVVRPEGALTLGLWLSGLSILMLGLTANIMAALLLAFTIFFYVVIYSMWLKRSTPKNIVIGGAAGAFPPIIGWVVVTEAISIEPILMFLIIFLWTPPHFWALALFVKDDYARAGVPMLTETDGPRVTRNQILLYAALLILPSLALAFTSVGGALYFAVALVLCLSFCLRSLATHRRDEATALADQFKTERKLFRASLTFLFVLFGALIVNSWTKPWLEMMGFTWPVLL